MGPTVLFNGADRPIQIPLRMPCFNPNSPHRASASGTRGCFFFFFFITLDGCFFFTTLDTSARGLLHLEVSDTKSPCALQGYLAHKKQHPPLGPLKGVGHSPTVGC